MESTEESGDDHQINPILSKENYDYIVAAGRWARTLSILGITIVSILLAGTFIVEDMFNSVSSSSGLGSGDGYRIRKKYFIDVSSSGYFLLFAVYAYWITSFYILFRFSGAAMEANHVRSTENITLAMSSLSLFFKLLVVGISLLILSVVLPIFLAF